MTPATPWPSLAVTLRFARQHGFCQNCFSLADAYWMECDEDDKPTDVAVCLCKACSDKLIEPHPRLFHQIGRNAPFKGIMDVCIGCPYHASLGCHHPESSTLAITQAPPMNAMVDGTDPKTRRRIGYRVTLWGTRATACSGRPGYVLPEKPPIAERLASVPPSDAKAMSVAEVAEVLRQEKKAGPQLPETVRISFSVPQPPPKKAGPITPPPPQPTQLDLF